MHLVYYFRISDPTFLIFVALVAVIGLIYAQFSRAAVVIRALRKMNAKRIADFGEDEVARVVGKVVFAGEVIVAPLSKRKCVYYHVQVEELRSSGKNSSWHTVIEEEIKGDLIIFDGSHYAIIDTESIKSYLVPDERYTSGTFDDATPGLEDFLQRHKYKSTNFLGFNRTLQYREGVLEKNELFTVVGKGNWQLTKNFKFNLPGEKVLVITPADNEPVYLSDDPEVAQKD